MINIKHFLGTLLICGALSMMIGCSMDERVNVDGKRETVPFAGREVPTAGFYPGVVTVKVTEDLAADLEKQQDVEGIITPAGVRSLNTSLSDVQLVSVERTFAHGGEFEPRMRAEGLHLWYDFHFEENTSLSKAGESISAIKGIQKVEYRPKLRRMGEAKIEYASPFEVAQRTNAATEYFNDPGLVNQWNFYNDGTFSDTAKAGCDINILPVWKKQIVGNPDVVVAVVDGGVEYTHVDLKDNMWTGVSEIGETIYGYNFYNDSYGIKSDEHGTHVAGTIAAVNNNGIGVCGIAGGDKERGLPGVKIMSCQIFQDVKGQSQASYKGGEAMVWAANHGAVISQCSWGYNLGASDIYALAEVDRVGIQYFIKYAGYDADGNQVGPMAGGVVIYSAGNGNRASIGLPGMFEECIAVAGVGSDFELAQYSNVGTWVDISAPGGETLANTDYFKKEEDGGGHYKDSYKTDAIYSTLPPHSETGVAYGYKSGTSMACPHVSGVAALIISEFGGVGFTNADLRAKLLSTTTCIDQYNPDFVRRMGTGLLNASNAVLGFDEADRPSAVSDLKAEALADNVKFTFTVPEGNPKAFYFLISEEQINKEDYGASIFTRFELEDFASGDVYNGRISTEKFNVECYVGVIMIGADGVLSDLSNVIPLQMTENNAPIIKALDGANWTIYNNREDVFRFLIYDKDEHTLSPRLIPNRNYITYNYEYGNDILEVKVDGATARVGKSTMVVRIYDEYDLYSDVEIEYEVVNSPAPDNIDKKQVRLAFYPNPVTDTLYVKPFEGIEEATVSVYSSVGSMVWENTVNLGLDPMVLSGLPAGPYTIKVMYKGEEVVEPIVKL